VNPAALGSALPRLQATWTGDGLFVWAAGGNVRTALAQIGLPEPGPRVEHPVAVRKPSVKRRATPGHALAVSDALAALVSLPQDVDVSDSVRCFSYAAKLAVELAAQERAVPTVTRGKARWRSLLTRPADRERLMTIAASLPPAARGAQADRGPIRLRDARDVVRAFLDDAIDHLYRTRAYPGPSRGWVRAWAESLRADSDGAMPRDARWAAIPDRIAQWASTADDPSPRVGFALELPTGEGEGFPLRLRLHAPAEPDVHVGLVDGWRAGTTLQIGDRSFPHPAEAALRGLARAARHYAPLERCLDGDAPTELVLDAAEAWEFLDTGRIELERAAFSVALPEDFAGAGRQRIRARIRLGPLEPGRDELTYHWEVLVGDRVLQGDEFADLMATGKPIVRWGGTWVFLDPSELARLPAELSEPGSLLLPEALRAVLTGLHDGVPVVASDGLQGFLDILRNPPHVAPPAGLEATLRGYQQEGFAWLTTLSTLGLGALLADDMGLGKTVQLIAHLLQRSAAEDGGPHLVICPTSVLGNWARELGRFAPSLRIQRWHGHDRAEDGLGDVDVVLTTYGLLVRDIDVLCAAPWDVLALDEAQSIKNPDSQRARAAYRLPARHRVALTGTPVENRLDELWSLMEFLVPSLLGPRRRFQREVAVPVERFADEDMAERLRMTVSPFLLRRVKTDPTVIDDLPDKLERREYCVLSAEQRTLYTEEVERALSDIAASESQQRRGRVLAMLTALKQICNHPAQFLRRGGGEDIEALVARSGKLDRLDELVESIAACGEHAVVFTQFRVMGELLCTHLESTLGEPIPFLHGGTPAAVRDTRVQSFQEDPWPAPVFVVSLRAGGTGLNLTRATHVVHYDRWWNPAVEDQATDRAYRIGQHRNVQVHKMVCEGTLEERIDALLEEKRELSRSIVGSGERWVTELDDDQLRRLVVLAGEGT